jgi:DNA (cytosine-5)-methyltransferase 1
MRTFYEFFAGGGMARLGLGPAWTCLLANDVCEKKARAYRANFGGEDLIVGDIRGLALADLPGRADLVWGSFPCQDLSLAGGGAGLAGARSGTFHALWDLIGGLAGEGRAPAVVVLENVCGALTSHGGADFAAIAQAFASGGYRLGPLILDAAWFTPQSRPRLFLVGVRSDLAVDPALTSQTPDPLYHPPALTRAVGRTGRRPLWWRLPAPPARNLAFADILDDAGWASAAETRCLLALMSEANRAKVAAARAASLNGVGRQVGAVFRRTRRDAAGRRLQRAEVRFDDVAGCLRTPAGGSSRQTVMMVEAGEVRTRLLSPRETARLMGLPEDYILPARRTDAYHLTGDGVSVDAVRWLAEHLLAPLLHAATASSAPDESRVTKAAIGA